MNLLVDNATVITCNKRVIHEGAVAIESSCIVDVGKSAELKHKYGRSYERIDATGKIVIPGLVNTHQHAAMSLLRGYADDLPLREWLEERIWPVEKHMTAHDIYVGALLTAAESVMSGTTTVNTMYHYMSEENEAKAFAETGLRAVVGHVCFSWRKEKDKKTLENLVKTWHNKANGLIRTSVDPHAPYTVDPEYMKELRNTRTELSEKYGSKRAPVITHIHVAETSDEAEKTHRAFNVPTEHGLMEYLDSLHVLDDHVVAAHCVTLTERDMTVMNQRGVKASHNPISNLKLASGISPVPEMLKQDVTVSLGTDSPCSNNSADMFEVMKMAAILHKGVNRDPTLMPAYQVLQMATIEGAKALAWENEIGSIEAGKKADLVVIDPRKPHLCPMHNEISQLVYATKGSDVDTVIVNGRILMESRKLCNLDVEKVMTIVEKTERDLLAKLRRQR